MLSPKQQRALTALLAAPTREAAARVCGISARTLYRLEHANSEFSAALEAGRRGALAEASRQLSTCAPAAVAALRGIVADPTEQAAARVAAAGKLLEYALRFAEAADLEQRIAALEREEEGVRGELC